MRDTFATFILRLALGGIFFWFGLDKIQNPSDWYGWVPLVIQNHLPVSMNHFLDVQGVVECALGIFVVFGFLTRLSCFFCILILCGIIYFMGFNEVMVRDLGLLAVALSLMISGPKDFSVDRLFGSKKRRY